MKIMMMPLQSPLPPKKETTAQKKKRDSIVEHAAKKQPEMPPEEEEAVEVTLLWDSGTQPHTMDDDHNSNSDDNTNFHYADDDTTTTSGKKTDSVDSGNCFSSAVMPTTTTHNQNNEHRNDDRTQNQESEMHQLSSLLISSSMETLLRSRPTVGTEKNDSQTVERALKHLTLLLGYDPPPYDDDDEETTEQQKEEHSDQSLSSCYSRDHWLYQTNRYAFFHEAQGIPMLVQTMLQWRTEPTILMQCIRAFLCGFLSMASSVSSNHNNHTPGPSPTLQLPADQRAAALKAVTWSMKRHPHHELLQYLACCYMQKLMEAEEEMEVVQPHSTNTTKNTIDKDRPMEEEKYWIRHAPVMVYWIVHALQQFSTTHPQDDEQEFAVPIQGGTRGRQTCACQALVALSRVDPDLHRLVGKAAAGHAVLIAALQT
jgi:hypothetical protein